MPATASAPELPIVPSVNLLNSFGKKLPLICGRCGQFGEYSVGRVMIDPMCLDDVKSKKPGAKLDDYMSYSGIFRCPKCGQGEKWQLPLESANLVIVELQQLNSGRCSNPRLYLGEMRVFDGTVLRTGAMMEDYLKSKIAADPSNAYLHSRLANHYDSNGLIALATECSLRALNCDPTHIDSLHLLGSFAMDAGRFADAKMYFDRLIQCARICEDIDPENLEMVVTQSLIALMIANHGLDLTDGLTSDVRIRTSRLDPEATDMSPNEFVAAHRIDLQTPAGAQKLVDLCLGRPVASRPVPTYARRDSLDDDSDFVAPLEVPLHSAVALASMVAPRVAETRRHFGRNDPISSHRIGRNDLCPCGSGRKFKKCCG